VYGKGAKETDVGDALKGPLRGGGESSLTRSGPNFETTDTLYPIRRNGFGKGGNKKKLAPWEK